MTLDRVYNLCLNKKGATEHFPFDEDVLVFKIGGKIFALMSLKQWENGVGSLSLKCDPDKAEELRATYPEITPAFHMSKKHWNTLSCTGNLPLDLIVMLLDHSYDLVFNSLTKKIKEELTKE